MSGTGETFGVRAWGSVGVRATARATARARARARVRARVSRVRAARGAPLDCP